MHDESEQWFVEDPKFLAALVSQAEAKSLGVSNPNWKRAYLALSDAADRLHAMMMRSTETEK